MKHKISNFRPDVVVIQFENGDVSDIIASLFENSGVECYTYEKPKSVPMIIIDCRELKTEAEILALEAKGICAMVGFKDFIDLTEKAHDLLITSKFISAANILQCELGNYSVKKICQIVG